MGIAQQKLLFSIEHILDLSPLKQYEILFKELDLSLLTDNSTSGRPAFDKRAILRAFIHRNLRGIHNLSELESEIKDNLSIAYKCGFDITKPLPAHDSYSRFLRDTSNHILQQIRIKLIKELIQLGHISGDFLSIDSMPIIANVKENNPKIFTHTRFQKDKIPKGDPDARLGIIVLQPDAVFPVQIELFKHPIAEKYQPKLKFFWGYRHHVICDALTELPIWERTCPANIHDSKLFIPLFSETKENFHLHPKGIIGDSAHDSWYIRQFIHHELKAKAFIPSNPRGAYKQPRFVSSGVPICIAGFQMLNWGTFLDRGRLRRKFVCPITHSKKFAKEHPSCPWQHPRFLTGKGCNIYSIVTDKPLAPYIDPNSRYFKQVYKLRVSSERIFSRFFNLPIQRPPVIGLKAVSNLMTIAHITLLILALTAIKSGFLSKTRSTKNLMRILSKEH